MKTITTIIVGIGFASSVFGRAVQEQPVSWLCSNAQIVVVGRVQEIKPSGIETSLSYPTVDGATFQWMRVTVSVVSFLKGGDMQETIDVALLAPKKAEASFFNGPLMIDPKIGESYIMFLIPSTHGALFASVFAPYDEENGVFILDRKSRRYDMENVRTKDYIALRQGIRDMIWMLADDEGRIQLRGIEQFQQLYQKELKNKAEATELPLEWKKHTNKAGWSTDVPKDSPIHRAEQDGGGQPATRPESE